MRRGQRGFTLIEMMMVIAIIGALAALAGAGLSTMSRFGRVNGTAEALSRVMASLRMRAMTERCPYLLQINGPTYNPPSTFRRAPATALVYRKGVCTSTNGFFEPALVGEQADRLIAEYPLGEARVELELPSGVFAAGLVLNASVTLSWNQLGQRGLAVDDDADGIATSIPLGGDLPITVRAAPGSDTSLPSRVISVPIAGRATLP